MSSSAPVTAQIGGWFPFNVASEVPVWRLSLRGSGTDGAEEDIHSGGDDDGNCWWWWKDGRMRGGEAALDPA